MATGQDSLFRRLPESQLTEYPLLNTFLVAGSSGGALCSVAGYCMWSFRCVACCSKGRSCVAARVNCRHHSKKPTTIPEAQQTITTEHRKAHH